MKLLLLPLALVAAAPYIWTSPTVQSDDEFVLEVHDLPIGEVNTQVLEFHYKRLKGGK